MQLATSSANSNVLSTANAAGDSKLGAPRKSASHVEGIQNSQAEPADVVCAEADRQIRMDWFLEGIQQQNCALFEAALYAARPALGVILKERLDAGDNQGLSDDMTVNLVVDDLIYYAFEQSQRWEEGGSVTAWLVSLLGELVEGL